MSKPFIKQRIEKIRTKTATKLDVQSEKIQEMTAKISEIQDILEKAVQEEKQEQGLSK